MPVANRLGLQAVGPAFYAGPNGMLRVSRRGLDSTRRHGHPELALTAETKLMPGVAVETEIPLWPTAMRWHAGRSEEHTSELQSLMRISYAVFCLKKKNT